MVLTDQQLEQRNALIERYHNDVLFYNLVNSIRAANKDSKPLTRGDWISAVLLAFDYWEVTITPEDVRNSTTDLTLMIFSNDGPGRQAGMNPNVHRINTPPPDAWIQTPQ